MHEFDSGFTVATPAWHGLGKVLAEAPDIESAVEMAGVGWTVEEHPVFADLGQSVDSVASPSDRMVQAARYKALVRSDTQRVLGVVGADYQPVQNRDAFRWFDFLLHDGDATLETGGSLRDGRRVWVLAKLARNGTAEVLPGDEVNSYILLSNAHDGSMGVWITFTPIRVVCMNTLSAALRGLGENDVKAGRALTFTHTRSVQTQMDLAKNLVDLASRRFDANMDRYRVMTKVPMGDAAFEAYIDEVFQVEDDRRAQDLRAWTDLRGLYEDGPGAEIPGVRGTVWAGFNAVTAWLDHVRGRTDDGRLESTWFGDSRRVRQRAFAVAEELVK